MIRTCLEMLSYLKIAEFCVSQRAAEVTEAKDVGRVLSCAFAYDQYV
jgi:hypothetical protein